MAGENFKKTLLAGAAAFLYGTGAYGADVALIDDNDNGNCEDGYRLNDEGKCERDYRKAPDILIVEGSQNVDIRRTEDDPQPYVVFDAEDIAKSGATTLEDYFRTRLPMNTQQFTNIEPGGGTGGASRNVSQINLRGLGTAQTLILIDGRRAPRVTAASVGSSIVNGIDLTQGDINGIPLSAIERIEILPATAGGIYGGGAVGGVINIIRKRDYRGLTLSAGYDTPFHGGGETYRVDVNGGLSLEDGRTDVAFSLSQTKSNPLYGKDNDIVSRGRALFYENSAPNTAFPGATPNITSVQGFDFVCLSMLPPGGNFLDCAVIPDLVLKGGISLGAPSTFVPEGYGGYLSDGGTPLLANAGEQNLELADDPTGRYLPLRQGSRVRSGNFNIRREFTPWLDIYADVTASENRTNFLTPAFPTAVTITAATPTNPFNQTVQVYFPQSELTRESSTKSSVLSALGGAIFELGGDWAANFEYSWSKQKVRSSYVGAPLTLAGYQAIANGTLDIFRDIESNPLDFSPYENFDKDNFAEFDTKLSIISGRISGSLFDLPGGALEITAAGEHRNEIGLESRQVSAGGGISNSFAFLIEQDRTAPERSQAVNSGYLELRAPLVSEENAIPLVHSFEVQASVRHDRYTTDITNPSVYFTNTPPTILENVTNKFNSTNYTLAGRWAPVSDLAFRGSYSTGFLPPSLSQIRASSMDLIMGVFGTPILDPQRGGELLGTHPYTRIRGDNPDLDPEQSKSISVGAVLTPGFLSGFRFSVDYTRIKKSDEIGAIGVPFLLENEENFPDRIQRGANLPGDPPGFAGPITLLDTTLINISDSTIKAWDFKSDYSFETTNHGEFRLYAVATHQTQLTRQISPDVDPYDTVGFADGPLKWRGNAGLEWGIGDWKLSWNTQYFDSYSVRLGVAPSGLGSESFIAAQGAERIPHQIYHDFSVVYRTPASSSSLLSNMSVSLGVYNVFDKKPPYRGSPSANAAFYSPYGDPRLRRVSLTITKSLDFNN